jgi:protein-glucosylgalactosylhydroxylysine glucosidase
MSDIISPDPLTEWPTANLPAYLSNGLVGLRFGRMPWVSGVTNVNGFEGMDPANVVEASARVPYLLGGDMSIGNTALSASPETVRLHEARYDFSCGEVRTRLHFDGHDARATLDMVTFCSRTQPALVLNQADLRVDRDCDLTLTKVIDTRGVPGRCVDRQVDIPGALAGKPVDGMMQWSSFGDLSTCGIAYLTELTGAEEVNREVDRSRFGPLSTTYSFRAHPDRQYRMRRVMSVLPQALHNEPEVHAVRQLQAGWMRGFDRLREDNRAAWDELWKGRVVLVGAPARWQALADAAFFYLHTSTHPSALSSSSVFGLAYWPNYHYYRGHVMWDVETFALPTLILTNPDAARGILDFRRTRLSGARANAAAAGRLGVQYPWESSLCHGQEAAPVDAATAAFEHHVSLDVAVAFARYFHATGDREFAVEQAWPVISGVAEWLGSRVERTARGYEIRGVIGIAESGSTVDNSAFVNMAAAVTLREAATLGRTLGRGTPDAWERVASEIVIPIDHDSGVILNHDGYHPDERMGETPEAPAGLFPLGFVTDTDTERRTFEFYLELAHKYAGAPMLSPMLGVYGARVGDRKAALDLFERGYADFIVEPFTITAEFSPKVYTEQPLAGPFTANLGGFLMACLYGLSGLRLKPGPVESWCERPVTMPQGWDGVHVERLWAHRRPAGLTAEHGADRARITLEHSPGQ